MKRRFVIGILGLIVFGGIALTLRCCIPRDPAMGGRPMSLVLEELETGTPAVREAAGRLLREAGANAFPPLLEWIANDRSDFTEWFHERVGRQPLFKVRYTPPFTRLDRAVLAFRTLGADALPAMPALTDLLLEGDAPMYSAVALAGLGTPAVGALTNALADRWAPVRSSAAFALGTVDPAPTGAVPALLVCLRDSDNYVRGMAARSLGEMAVAPEIVIPALTLALRDGSSEVRRHVVVALGGFGQRAKPAVGELEKLSGDSDRRVSEAAAVVLKKIAE